MAPTQPMPTFTIFRLQTGLSKHVNPMRAPGDECSAVTASLSPPRHCGCAGGSGAGGGPAARWSENSGGAAAGR